MAQSGSVECEYLVDGEFCKSIIKDKEGKATRQKWCLEAVKNLCCYLCARRESCEISCSYLDTSRKPSSLDRNTSSRTDGEIKKHQEEIGKLSVLLANGKIGEKSYLVATNALEHKIEELQKIKESPSPLLTSETALPQSREFEDLADKGEQPTSLWYVVPILFGIIGGIVAYVGTKDEDREMADRLLALGIVCTVVLIFVYWYIVASILLH
jgi:hypothetical protein